MSSTCGLFQLHLYINIFDPEEKNKIINHKTLNKKTLEAILNEICTTDIDENKHVIENFQKEFDLLIYF